MVKKCRFYIIFVIFCLFFMVDSPVYSCGTDDQCGTCKSCINKYCVSCENCCNGSCCSGECCNGHCIVPCDPDECESCGGSGNCVVCGGDWTKGCCDGQCYDKITKTCCGDGNGTACPHYDKFLPEQVCCNGDCYNPDANEACCGGTTKYSTDAERCCGYGTGKTCPKTKNCCYNIAAGTATCCDPCECETCVNGECKVCGGDPNKECCGGQCITKCDPNQCMDCNSTTKVCDYLCKPDECCVNGECKSPMCDNCRSVSDVLWECQHLADDPNGAQCYTTYCIQNILSTATCGYKGDDWPCKKSRCDTQAVSPWQPAFIQITHASSCPGGTVNWVIWQHLYYGCTSCSDYKFRKSCEASSCDYNPLPGSPDGRSTKMECGKCSY